LFSEDSTCVLEKEANWSEKALREKRTGKNGKNRKVRPEGSFGERGMGGANRFIILGNGVGKGATMVVFKAEKADEMLDLKIQ